MSRRVILGVVFVAVVAGLGSTAQTDGAPIAPYHEDATEAELAFYDAAIPCPPIDGLEQVNRVVGVDTDVTITCQYRIPDTSATQSVTVTWLKTDAAYDADFLCFDQGERSESGDTLRDVVNPDPTHAVRAEYGIDRGAAFEPALAAVAEQLITAATAYARVCAEQPEPLECPQVPRHPLASQSEEASDFQVDTFSWECSYEASSSTTGDELRIEVWWAAPSGVPELYDRLCNELPYEGVGFGVLVADGIAANATYWLVSPLEGPDREVGVAAAQELLEQAAAQAASCDGAEDLPSAFVPFPNYLDDQFTEELTAAPSTGPVDQPATGDTEPVPAAATGDGLLQTLLRIGSVVMLVLSILGLFITFLLIRRETRIRERRDMLRIGVTLAVAVASILIIGRHAPLWAVLMGIGLGLALGTWQGSNLMVRNTPGGLMARRSMIAIVAFATGVIALQVAGLLNRTGIVAVGVGVSFLSAAITAGLFVGRKPRMTEALGGAARILLPAAVVVGALAGIATNGAAQQTEPAPGTCAHAGLGNIVLDGCEGYQNLLDVVPWDEGFISGGLWSSHGKPPAAIALPRALATPPQPVSQTVAWSGVDFGDNPVEYAVTETYSFGALADGTCCSVFYEGSGTATTTRSDGEVDVETREASGRLTDVHPFGTIPLGNEPIGIPFSEQLTLRGFPEDSCQRVVAWQQDDNEEGAATWDTLIIDGEAQTTAIDTGATIFVDCDLPDFTWEHAFELAPPPPAADSADRQLQFPASGRPPEVCPVRQEFAAFMWEAGQFDGVSTRTLADMFLEPNAFQCDYGGLFDPPSFGQGGPGQTRHEIIYRLAILNDPVAEAVRLADDEDTFFSESRTTSIAPHLRCEVGPDGVPLPPPEGENCLYASIHTPGQDSGISGIRSAQLGALRAVGGQVSIRTEYVPDGPNVWVRAHLPWGKYVYRCHHCEPGDPRITQFINRLHRFGTSRGLGAPTAGPDDATTPTTAAPDTTVAEPADSGRVTLTPVGDEEGISTEEAALIGLVGLLGSMGILASSLEGTGLTPADIAAAIRRGDLTGGVATAPPPLLDENGEPLIVNDGSYPEAPVGHVWWGTGGDEGRWVSPDEAQVLVTDAAAADTALEEERVGALHRAREQADEDWQELIRTSRAEAAQDRLQAAMDREGRQTLIEGTVEAREAAAAGGYDDLLDFMERNPILTADQIEAVFDAVNRRGTDEAALEAIPEVNVVRETITGSLETAAQMAEAGGRPDIAWILRNPGTTARVGAAVATGGYSEFVAIPISIGQTLHEAQERSLAENGRMMTSGELFGELGWALGTEAVYEAGGRLVGHGLGAVFSSGDELAEAAVRSGDEALPGATRAGGTVDEGLEAGARKLDDGMKAGARQVDEGLEAGARKLDDGAETGARELDEGMETAGREVDEGLEAGAGPPAEDLTPVPPKGNERLAAVPTGGRIDDDLIPETGLTRSHLEEVENYARDNDLNVTGRASNPRSGAVEDAVNKPIEIKIKTGTDLDVMLGAQPQNRGVVTLFEPKMPDTRGMSPELVEVLHHRHAQRMAEWTKYQETWTRGNRVAEFGGVERTHRYIDGRIEVLVDGRWRQVKGDFDLVDITRADGTPLSPAEFQQHVDAMVERGLIEHGGEVRVMTDVMRNNPHPPGSDEWMEQAREVWRLRNDLENAHLEGAEIIVGINGREGLHRGPRLDEFLPWRGGFEQAGGGLIQP